MRADFGVVIPGGVKALWFPTPPNHALRPPPSPAPPVPSPSKRSWFDACQPKLVLARLREFLDRAQPFHPGGNHVHVQAAVSLSDAVHVSFGSCLESDESTLSCPDTSMFVRVFLFLLAPSFFPCL